MLCSPFGNGGPSLIRKMIHIQAFWYRMTYCRGKRPISDHEPCCMILLGLAQNWEYELRRKR